jgi:hypothetical protein
LAKYMITFFVFSVFPAPDSPLWRKYHKYYTLSFIESTMCLDKKKAMRKGITVKYKTSLCFCFVAATSLTIIPG